MASQMLLPEIANRPAEGAPSLDVRMRLSVDLRAWWAQEQQAWDTQVAGGDMTGDDLWGCMPAVDSKTVARMAPIFKQHGRPFNVRDIRRGGYDSINETIQDLVFGK